MTKPNHRAARTFAESAVESPRHTIPGTKNLARAYLELTDKYAVQQERMRLVLGKIDEAIGTAGEVPS